MHGIVAVAAIHLATSIIPAGIIDASKFGVVVPTSKSRGRRRLLSLSAVLAATNYQLTNSSTLAFYPTTRMMVNNRVFSFFSSSSRIDEGSIESTSDTPQPSISSLMKEAKQVRDKLYGKNKDDATKSLLPSFIHDLSTQLCYPSSTYDMIITDNGNNNKKTSVQRGYCNWLLPNKLMIGSYPGMTPEINGPTQQESRRHIQNMVQNAKITLFCCLQSEVPCQMDDSGWKATKQIEMDSELGNEDVIYLEPDCLRREFPRPFTRYGPLAQSFSSTSSVEFLHSPIDDLGVPSCNTKLFSLLSNLLNHLQLDDDKCGSTDDRAIYLHCWGGRGRAGLVGACLTSLLFPELSSTLILDWIQCGYDSRRGAESMAHGLTRSPQTKEQRLFVEEFVAFVHEHAEKKEEKI